MIAKCVQCILCSFINHVSYSETALWESEKKLAYYDSKVLQSTLPTSLVIQNWAATWNMK